MEQTNDSNFYRKQFESFGSFYEMLMKSLRNQNKDAEVMLTEEEKKELGIKE